MISIFTGTQGFLDDVAMSRIGEFEDKLLQHVRSEFPEIRDQLIKTGELDDALAQKLKDVIGNFKKQFNTEEK